MGKIVEAEQEQANVAGESWHHAAARLRTHSSSLIAKILEYQLLGAIGAELLSRGQTLEILRGDIDADGHDVIVEANGIIRHIQLKSKVAGGTTGKVTCHTALASKPSGCVIWITYDPATYLAIEYGCFGGAAGERLPDLGTKIAYRSTHNKNKERPPRLNHRELKLKRFEQLTLISDLVDWLFGSSVRAPVQDGYVVINDVFGRPTRIEKGPLSATVGCINLTDRLLLIWLNMGTMDSSAHIGGQAASRTLESCVTLDLNAGSWEADLSGFPHEDAPKLLDLALKVFATLAHPPVPA